MTKSKSKSIKKDDPLYIRGSEKDRPDIESVPEYSIFEDFVKKVKYRKISGKWVII